MAKTTTNNKAKPPALPTVHSQLLAHYFQALQNDEDEVDIERAVQKVQNYWMNEHTLNARLFGLSLDDQEVEEGSNDAAVVTHILDCIVGSVETNGDSTTARRLLELLAAVLVVANKKKKNAISIVTRIVAFSECAVESVRSSMTFLIGKLLERFSDDHGEATYDALQQALVARFTDKAVSVRAAAVSCCKVEHDPDITTSKCWILQHDPSATNRALSAKFVPISLQTIDYIIHRIRDVKESVRVAALEAFVGHQGDLEAHHMAAIVQAGWTERCATTKEATRRLMVHWIKQARYDTTELLHRLSVLEHPTECEHVLQALCDVDPATVAELYSDSEIRALQQAVSSTDFCIDELVEDSYSIERLFFARCILKDSFFTKVVPDVPRLVQVLQHFCTQLVQAIANNNQDMADRLVFCCLQLLGIADKFGNTEEGSRRVLKSTMNNMLSDILTPDDLIEPCVKILKSHDFLDTIQSILDTLETQKTDELETNYCLRIVSILTIVLGEESSSLLSTKKVKNFERYIMVNNLQHSNSLVREAAVECLGKLGIVVETVRVSHWTNLLEIACDETERTEIRAQAMLALFDWSTCPADPDFVRLVSTQVMEVSNNNVIAAEIAAKLMVTGKAACDSVWLAHLVKLYFEETDNDDDDVELGSALRLQQLLTVFFPCIVQRKAGRDALIQSVKPLLASLKKAKKAVSKMIDYICSTVGREEDAESSSPELVAAVQVAAFVSEKSADLSTAYIRALCKIVASLVVELDIDKELYEHLSLLKELVDELMSNVVEDDITCLKYLTTVAEQLLHVEMEEDVGDNEESSDNESATTSVVLVQEEEDEQSVVQDELTGAMENLTIAPSTKANVAETNSTTRRSSRRLRPSN